MGKIMVLGKGFMWNPLLRTPRNVPCPCGSGIKFKKCHLNKLSPAIPTPDKMKEIIAEATARAEKDKSEVTTVAADQGTP